jgi:uncharacterized protein involved in exopolysaccharide biosynthesis
MNAREPGNAGSYVSVWQLLSDLWNGRAVIGAATIAGTVAGLGYAFLATSIFRSEALVQPRLESRAAGGLGALAAQLGGFGDLAGLSLGGGGDRAVAMATLQSRVLVETFIKDMNLLPKLYPSKWDEEAGAWKSNDPSRTPTTWQAYTLFTREVMKVIEDKKSGLVSVVVEWKDPQEAQQWATELVARTNAYLRAAAIQEGEKNLAYLEQQSRTIGQVELREALYNLVEAEQKKLMLAKGGDEFALKTIDPAVVPTKRARPKRAVAVAIGFLVGAFGGAGLALFLKAWRERPSLGQA